MRPTDHISWTNNHRFALFVGWFFNPSVHFSTTTIFCVAAMIIELDDVHRLIYSHYRSSARTRKWVNRNRMSIRIRSLVCVYIGMSIVFSIYSIASPLWARRYGCTWSSVVNDCDRCVLLCKIEGCHHRHRGDMNVLGTCNGSPNWHCRIKCEQREVEGVCYALVKNETLHSFTHSVNQATTLKWKGHTCPKSNTQDWPNFPEVNTMDSLCSIDTLS